MTAQRPPDYNISQTTYPFEFQIRDLEIDMTYYFLIRAVDSAANEGMSFLLAYAYNTTQLAWHAHTTHA